MRNAKTHSEEDSNEDARQLHMYIQVYIVYIVGRKRERERKKRERERESGCSEINNIFV